MSGGIRDLFDRGEKRAELAWSRAAERLALEYHDWGIAGETRGFGVQVRRRDTVDQLTNLAGQSTSIRVDGGGRIPEGLQLRAKRLGDGDRDITTGDRYFDADVHLVGEATEALAVLTQRARQAVFRFLTEDPLEASIAGGVVGYTQEGLIDQSKRLVTLVQRMAKLAKLLSLDRAEIPRRLEANAANDSDPRVRLRNLEVLVRAFPGDESAWNAARGALSDRDARVRLFGAMALREEGWEVLIALARSGTEPELRAIALEELGKFAGERAWPSIEAALDAPEPMVRRAAVLAAETARPTALLPRIVGLCDTEDEDNLPGIAAALGQLGDPEAEPALIKLLSHDSDRVKCAAAAALGAVGTVAAVEALLSQTKGLFLSGELKRAALLAVAAIQSRVTKAEAGGLSLADEGQAGALSLAEVAESEAKPK